MPLLQNLDTRYRLPDQCILGRTCAFSCVLTGLACRRSSLRLPLTSHMVGLDKGPSPMPSARRGMRSHRQAICGKPPKQKFSLSGSPRRWHGRLAPGLLSIQSQNSILGSGVAGTVQVRVRRNSINRQEIAVQGWTGSAQPVHPAGRYRARWAAGVPGQGLPGCPERAPGAPERPAGCRGPSSGHEC